jgi:hypothetical protein
MNWPWLPPRRRDIACIFAVIIVVGIFVFVFTKYPYVGWMANKGWGFGPDWNCSYPGQGEPVCIKRSPAQSNNSN